MKKYCKSLVMALVVCFGTVLTAHAHTLWVTAKPAKPEDTITVIRGYSDHFPILKPIAEKRLVFLPAPKLIAPDGKMVQLKAGGTDSEFVAETPAVTGTYLVTGEYLPTYWTQSEEGGWTMQPKNEVKGKIIQSYRHAAFAKGVYNVGGALDTELITRPLGTLIELVPLANPSAAKVGDTIRFQAFYQGKPLPEATVTAMVEGYGDGHEIKAFMSTTDAKGIVEFIPWKAGFWQVEVHHSVAPGDASKGNSDNWNAMVSFSIPE